MRAIKFITGILLLVFTLINSSAIMIALDNLWVVGINIIIASVSISFLITGD